MLVSPSIKPNGPYRFLVPTFSGLTRIRVLYRRFGLLWTLASEVPLNLMQKACLAKAPITVDAEYLWRGTTRDSLADFLNQHLSTEGIQQSRFIIVHGNTFLTNLNHKVSETGHRLSPLERLRGHEFSHRNLVPVLLRPPKVISRLLLQPAFRAPAETL